MPTVVEFAKRMEMAVEHFKKRNRHIKLEEGAHREECNWMALCGMTLKIKLRK